MHVSYEAAIRQMTNVRLISESNRDDLLRVRPALIKQTLADGLTLPDARGDVWVFDRPEEQVRVEAFVGDAIVLRLVERPSTGYRWCTEPALDSGTVHQLRPPPPSFESRRAFADDASGLAEIISMPRASTPSEVVTLLRDEIVRDPYQVNATTVGGAVTRLVAYGAGAPGQESIHLSEVRPFQPEARVSTLEVSTLVRGNPEVEFRRRLIQEFMRGEADAGEWNS
jgi:hypothetical protein